MQRLTIESIIQLFAALLPSEYTDLVWSRKRNFPFLSGYHCNNSKLLPVRYSIPRIDLRAFHASEPALLLVLDVILVLCGA